jgi:hypothetical protein
MLEDVIHFEVCIRDGRAIGFDLDFQAFVYDSVEALACLAQDELDRV